MAGRIDEGDSRHSEPHHHANTPPPPQTFALGDPPDVGFGPDFGPDVYAPAGERGPKHDGQIAGGMQTALSLAGVQGGYFNPYAQPTGAGTYAGEQTSLRGDEGYRGYHQPAQSATVRMQHELRQRQRGQEHHLLQQQQQREQYQFRVQQQQEQDQQQHLQRHPHASYLHTCSDPHAPPHHPAPLLSTPPSLPASSWVQQWQHHPPNPALVAQQYTDFWAVLRLSALARRWFFPPSDRPVVSLPPERQKLSRGVVSMYICPRANCAAEATTASRTVLHRSAGILVPVEASAGVVVGHFVEVVWTPAVGGTHDESRLRGKYIMCARTREVVKIYSSASESSGTLSIDRSVMVSDGVFLRDFIKVSIPPSHPPETVPGTFTVATRTTVLHTRADAPDVDGEASVEYDASSDLPPFALLEMSDQTAAEVAINPSYGFSGFGSYRMAFTQSLAGVNVAGDGVSTRPSLGLPWTPPAHCAVCPAPVWSLQKLNRKEAADLRGLFHKAYVEAPALRARVGRTMSLPGAGGALGGQRQAAENENRIDSLLQMSMTNRNSAPANLSLPVGQATAGGVSSSFVSASIPKARVLQSSHVQSALVPPSLSPTTLAQTAIAPVQLSSPTLAPSPLATPSLAPGTLVQSPVAQGSHSQASLLRPAASPYSPLVPRMSPHVNLAPGDMADNRNFGVRQMLSSNTKPGNISSPFPLQAAVLSVAPPASAVPTQTKRGGKYVLPAPTESDVVMRNRISAQRSNDKRRRKMEAMKNEVAVLHDQVLPKLELQLESLKTENVHLRTKVKDLFDLPQLVSFY